MKSDKPAKEVNKKGGFQGKLLSIIILLAGLLSASYVATGTWDFDGQFKQISTVIRKFLPEVYILVSKL